MVTACHKFWGFVFVWVWVFFWKGTNRAILNVFWKSGTAANSNLNQLLNTSTNYLDAWRKQIIPTLARNIREYGMNHRSDVATVVEKTRSLLGDVISPPRTNTHQYIFFGSCFWELFRCKVGACHFFLAEKATVSPHQLLYIPIK